MIDNFNQVFTQIKAAITSEYPNAYCVSERIPTPSQFPCVWIVELDSVPDARYLTFNDYDSQVKSSIEIQAFSNSNSEASAEAKGICKKAREALTLMGYRCLTFAPIENADVSIKRHVARFSRLIGDSDTIPTI